jgi:hypothetical protein
MASFEDYIGGHDGESFPAWIPIYKNLNHWFKEPVVNKLSYLKQKISQIDDIDSKMAFTIAFSLTVMKSSNVNWKSSRYIRTFPEKELESYEPEVFTFFMKSLAEVKIRINSYMKRKKSPAFIVRGDARALPLDNGAVNLVITSPPYGEERNTIPYVRWSKLLLLWVGFETEQIPKIEKEALGGKSSSEELKDIPSKHFRDIVRDVSPERLKEALPFMFDYFRTLIEMKRVLKKGGRSCIVIGNRSISRKLINMGEVTREFGEAAGFHHEKTYERRIPKKMIPWVTPTGDTISAESIVVLRKK